MFDEAVGDCPSTTEYVPDRFKTQEMCYRVISDDPFSLQHVPD